MGGGAAPAGSTDHRCAQMYDSSARSAGIVRKYRHRITPLLTSTCEKAKWRITASMTPNVRKRPMTPNGRYGARHRCSPHASKAINGPRPTERCCAGEVIALRTYNGQGRAGPGPLPRR